MYLKKTIPNKAKLLALFFCLFFLSCSRKSSDTLLQDLAQIDYNYADTLIKVSSLDRESSITALSNFARDWRLFRKYYYNINEEDYLWKNDIGRLSDTVIRVNYFATEDEDISAGYLIFHDVKDILSDIRRRNNIDWAFDYLSIIYRVAIRLNELSLDYSTQKHLSDEDKNRIISVYISLDSRSKELLEKMEKNIFPLYQFDDEQKTIMLRETTKLDAIVFSMGVYFVDGNYKEIHKLTEALIGTYFYILDIYASHSKEFK